MRPVTKSDVSTEHPDGDGVQPQDDVDRGHPVSDTGKHLQHDDLKAWCLLQNSRTHLKSMSSMKKNLKAMCLNIT